MKLKNVEKYGTKVWSNEKMDELRKENCLCLNCGLMETCSNADELYMICKQENLALMVTRCPHWWEVKDETTG